MLCEMTILDLKKEYHNIEFHIIMPCPFDEQTMKWTEEQKDKYRTIINSADSIEVISGHLLLRQLKYLFYNNTIHANEMVDFYHAQIK